MSTEATSEETLGHGNDDAKTKQEEKMPSDGSGDGQSAGRSTDKYIGITKLRDFLRTRRLELAMLVTRILTIILAFFYIVPIFGSSILCLRRALISNAATSGIRLYQRLSGIPFSVNKEYIAHLVIEDSFHHLIYSLMFIYFGPISFSVIPIILFASLNVANFTRQMLEIAKGPDVKKTGFGSFLFFCTSNTPWILKLAATAEIGLMGVILFNCIRGTVSIITPFVYYRFLYLRYASKRNHYTRMVFYEMRMATERFIAQGCPMLVARIIRTVISILCKLAPGRVIR